MEVGGARDGEQLYLYLYLVHKLGFSKVDISHYRHYRGSVLFPAGRTLTTENAEGTVLTKFIQKI